MVELKKFGPYGTFLVLLVCTIIQEFSLGSVLALTLATLILLYFDYVQTRQFKMDEKVDQEILKIKKEYEDHKRSVSERVESLEKTIADIQAVKVFNGEEKPRARMF